MAGADLEHAMFASGIAFGWLFGLLFFGPESPLTVTLPPLLLWATALLAFGLALLGLFIAESEPHPDYRSP